MNVLRWVMGTCAVLFVGVLHAQTDFSAKESDEAESGYEQPLGCENASCSPVGMIQHDINDYTGELLFRDQPLGYAPERGPWLPFEVKVSESDNRQMVGYRPGSEGRLDRAENMTQMHLGMKASIGWLAYVESRLIGNQDVTWYPPGGGFRYLPVLRSRYHPEWPGCADVHPTTACLYAPPQEGGVTIRKVTVREPSAGGGGLMLEPGSFVVTHLSSGVVEEYGAVRVTKVWNFDPTPIRAGDPTSPPRGVVDVTRVGYRAYLSRIVDRNGLSLTFGWDESVDSQGDKIQGRLLSVVDALGRRTELKYATDYLEQWPGRTLDRDHYLLVQVVDPYGRKATLEYVDAVWGTDPVHSRITDDAITSEVLGRRCTAPPGGMCWALPSLWRIQGGVARTGYLGGTYRGYTRLVGIVDVVGVRSALEWKGGFHRSELAGGDWLSMGRCSSGARLPDFAEPFGYSGDHPPSNGDEGEIYRRQMQSPGANQCNAGVLYRQARDLRSDQQPDLVVAHVTPYGKTEFFYGDVDGVAEVPFKRRRAIRDPNGNVERVEAWFGLSDRYLSARLEGTYRDLRPARQSQSWLELLSLDGAMDPGPCRGEASSRDPLGLLRPDLPEVPGCEKVEAGGAARTGHGGNLYYRNTYHWTKKATALAQAQGIDPLDLQVRVTPGFTAGTEPLDEGSVLPLNTAVVHHFLLRAGPLGGGGVRSPVKGAYKRPGLPWVYYVYDNQGRAGYAGGPLSAAGGYESDMPWRRVLEVTSGPAGVLAQRISYNAQGNVVETVEPSGMGYRLEYAAGSVGGLLMGVDLKAVYRTGNGWDVPVQRVLYYGEAGAPALGAGLVGPYVYEQSDDAGYRTRYGYDGSGRVNEVSAPDHEQNSRYGRSISPLVTRIAYQDTDLVRGNWTVTATGASGSVASAVYAGGLLRQERIGSGAGAVTLRSYDYRPNEAYAEEDGFGRVWRVTDERGRQRRYEYTYLHQSAEIDEEGNTTRVVRVDGMKRPVWIQLPGQDNVGNASPRDVTFDYDPSGGVRAMSEPNGTYTQYEYDLLGRMVSEWINTEQTRRVDYDGWGRISHVWQDGGTRAEQYHYDGLNRVTARWAAKWDAATGWSPWRQVVYFKYDEYGRLRNYTDARGFNRIVYETAWPLRIQETETPLGTDEAGRSISVGGRLQRTARGQVLGLARYEYRDGVAAGNAYAWRDVYTDPQGRVTGISSEGGEMALEYAPWAPNAGSPTYGQLTRRVMAFNSMLPDAGNEEHVVQELDYHGQAQGFALSHMGYRVNVDDERGTSSVNRWYEQYDGLRRLTQERKNAIVGTDTIQMNYQYRAEGWLNQVTRQLGSGSGTPAIETTSFDRAGNWTQIQRSDGERTLGIGAQYTAPNQMWARQLWDGRTAYPQYAYGQHHSVGLPGATDEQQVRYDYEGRMAGIRYADGSTSEFTYDGMGYLMRARELAADGTATSDLTYLWSGEKVREVRDTRTKALLRIYSGMGMKDAQTGRRYAILKDRLGSPIATTDDTGHVIERYDYDAYGQRIDAAGQDIPNPLHTSRLDIGYTGLLRHAKSGTYIAHYRSYDPTLRRFTSRDPIGYAGGLNFMAYVNNDPINNTDPSGLTPRDPHACRELFLQYVLMDEDVSVRDAIALGLFGDDGQGYPGRSERLTSQQESVLNEAQWQQNLRTTNGKPTTWPDRLERLRNHGQAINPNNWKRAVRFACGNDDDQGPPDAQSFRVWGNWARDRAGLAQVSPVQRDRYENMAGDETFSHMPAPGGMFGSDEALPVAAILGVGILGVFLIDNPLFAPALAPVARRVAPALFGR